MPEKTFWARCSRSIHVHFILAIFIRGGGAAISLAFNVLLARQLGVAEYGHYMSLFAVVLVLSGLAVSGTDILLTRELSAGAAWHARARLALKKWTVRRVLTGIVPAAMLYLLWALVIQPVGDGGLIKLLEVGSGLIIVLLPLCMLTAGALNGYGLVQRGLSLISLIQNSGSLALLALLWLAVGGIHSSATALAVRAGGYAFALILGWRWLRAAIRKSATCDFKPHYAVTSNSQKRWSQAANGFLMLTIINTLSDRLDLVLVSGVAGNHVAGIYAAGSRFAQVAMMVALSINVVLCPNIASAWAHNDSTRLRRLIRLGFLFSAPTALIEVAVAVWASPVVIAIFGVSYASATGVFTWSTIAYALWTFAAPGYALLMMTGSEKAVAMLSAVVVVLNLTAIALLVPTLGAVGAAISMAIAYAVILPALIILTTNKMRFLGSAAHVVP